MLPDDTFRDQFRTQDEGLTALVTYSLRLPGAEWFIAEVQDALYSMTFERNWEKVGSVTIDEAIVAASNMAASFASMIGLILPIALATLPDNMLLCDGSTHNRVDYPNLYALLDSAFIVDTDTFVTPDLLNRVVVGAGDDYAVNDSGGEATHTLTSGEMPSHTHVDTGHTHLGAYNPGVVPAQVGAGAAAAPPLFGNVGIGSAAIQSAGGGGAHNNLQPYRGLVYGIIAK